MKKLSFVLPLKINAGKGGSDLERVRKVLLPSMVKFFNPARIDKFLCVSSDEYCEAVRDFLT